MFVRRGRRCGGLLCECLVGCRWGSMVLWVVRGTKTDERKFVGVVAGEEGVPSRCSVARR